MFLVHLAPLDLEGSQVQLDHRENQVMEVQDPRESQGFQGHQDTRLLGNQVHQDYLENKGREDHMDLKEILDLLAYQVHGVHQDYRESLDPLEFPLQENLDNKDL